MSPVSDMYGKKDLAQGAHRVAMCQIAASTSPHVMVDDWEMRQPGYTRTLLVLRHVAQEFEKMLSGASVRVDGYRLCGDWLDGRTQQICPRIVLGEGGQSVLLLVDQVMKLRCSCSQPDQWAAHTSHVSSLEHFCSQRGMGQKQASLQRVSPALGRLEHHPTYERYKATMLQHEIIWLVNYWVNQSHWDNMCRSHGRCTMCVSRCDAASHHSLYQSDQH